MEFKKVELLKEVMTQYYEVYSITLDTCDFVPKKSADLIYKNIFKSMKTSFKQSNVEYKRFYRVYKKFDKLERLKASIENKKQLKEQKQQK